MAGGVGGALVAALLAAVRDGGDAFGEATAPLTYCGCGDGTLKLLQGHDLQWTELAETRLDGEILSLTVSADGAELIAGTSAGNVYRLDARSLSKLDAERRPTHRPRRRCPRRCPRRRPPRRRPRRAWWRW